MTAIAWRLATAGVTGRPVSGAATAAGVGAGVAVGVGVAAGEAVEVGVGDAVGAVVGLAVGGDVGLCDTTARPLGDDDGAAAPAAMTPAPMPVTTASPSAAMRTGRPAGDRPATVRVGRPEPRPDPWRGVAIRRGPVWRVATVPSSTPRSAGREARPLRTAAG